MDFGDANDVHGGVEVLVHFGFEVELGEFGVGFFEFGSILFGRIVLIFGEVDLTEGAGAELPDEAEVVADD